MAFGDVIRSVPAPSDSPQGIGGQADKIWLCAAVLDKLYELSVADFSVVQVADSPTTVPRGMGGSDTKVWHCGTPTQDIYELDVSDLSVVRSESPPDLNPFGIGGDSDTIWHCEVVTDELFELSTVDFSVIRSQASPFGEPEGIGGNATKIWHCDRAVDRVFELSTSDWSVVQWAGTATFSIWPAGIGGDDYTLWLCDSWNDTIYELASASIVAPTVTTYPASVLLAIAATLNGTLDDDGGEACDCGFQWGETDAYGNTTPTQSRTTGQTFAQTITGLDENKTYHFRAFATNAAGTSYGADRIFTTPILAPPTVTTDLATLVEATAATPNGTLDDDGGEACDCGFQWGETIAYGNTTPTQSRTTGQTFAQALAGLDPNKTYHFRAFATNSMGTSYGADRTFTTLVALPAVTTDLATDSILNGTLDNDGGMACDCGFESGETIAYEHGATLTQSRTTGQTFSQILGGLVPGTTYHYRAFATNGAGTRHGADRTFATPAGLPTVATWPATGIGMILGVLNGRLDDDGGEICECGFVWGADTTYGLTTPTVILLSVETFSQLIRGLFPGTEYHFRAFATNSVGTAYGDDESFYSKPSVSRAYALAREEL